MHESVCIRRAVQTVVYAVATILVGSASVVAADTGSSVIVTEDGKKLDAYLTRLSRLGYAGAAVVEKDGRIILRKGYGLADRDAGRPVAVDTVFTVGSITKQFTGAAIMKLVSEGKLDVNDPITKYFDGVPKDKAAITIHQLLTHTAGFPDALGSDFDDTATESRFQQLAMNCRLGSAPGKRFEYSNVGYSLLGMIIAKVSGKPYEAYMRDALFKPVVMLDTGYLLPGYSEKRLAVGYRDGERWGTILERPMLPDGPNWHLRANGGVHSTVHDMFLWHKALEGDAVLPASAREVYFAPHADEGSGDSSYGYGWVNFKTRRGTRLLAHNGGNGVFSADFRRYVEEGVAIFATSTSSEFMIDPITEQMERIVFEERHKLPPETVTLSSEVLARLSGRFRFAGGGEVDVVPTTGGIRLRARDQASLSVLAPSSFIRDALNQLNARAVSLTRDSYAGKVEPLRAALGGGVPPAQLEKDEAKAWAARKVKHGALQEVTAIGTAPFRRRMLATTVCLQFERGTEYVSYIWSGSTLAGVRASVSAPGASFYPQSEDKFIAYRIRERFHPTLRFERGEGGKVTTLVYAGAHQDAKATRIVH